MAVAALEQKAAPAPASVPKMFHATVLVTQRGGMVRRGGIGARGSRAAGRRARTRGATSATACSSRRNAWRSDGALRFSVATRAIELSTPSRTRRLARVGLAWGRRAQFAGRRVGSGRLRLISRRETRPRWLPRRANGSSKDLGRHWPPLSLLDHQPVRLAVLAAMTESVLLRETPFLCLGSENLAYLSLLLKNRHSPPWSC